MEKIKYGLIGLILGALIVCFYTPDPEIIIDNRKIDSLKSEVIKIDSLLRERSYKIDSLKAEIINLDKDSTRIVTRYETRIKYITRYTPSQLDSVLTARYK